MAEEDDGEDVGEDSGSDDDDAPPLGAPPSAMGDGCRSPLPQLAAGACLAERATWCWGPGSMLPAAAAVLSGRPDSSTCAWHHLASCEPRGNEGIFLVALVAQ